MQKEELLKRTLDVYKGLSTYREIAFRSGHNFKMRDFDIKIDFKIQTWFARPSYLRIECELVSTVNGGEKDSELIFSFKSNESKAVEMVNDTRAPIKNPLVKQLFAPWDTAPVKPQRSTYISADEGLSKSPMLKMFAPLAGLLINPDHHFLTARRGVAQFPDEQVLHNRCHQLVVYHGKPLTNDRIWIDSKSHLILRVMTPLSPFEIFPLNLIDDFFKNRGIGIFGASSEPMFPLSEDYIVHYYEIDPQLNISMFQTD